LNQDSVLVVWRGQPIALASLSQGAIKPKRVFNLS
jgi:hypothetical protein